MFILFRSTKVIKYIILTTTAIEKCSTRFKITIQKLLKYDKLIELLKPNLEKRKTKKEKKA